MKEEKNNLDIIKNYPNYFTPNEQLLERAKKEIQEDKQKSSRAFRSIRKKILCGVATATSCACIGIIVGVSVYNNMQGVVYYTNSNVEEYEITDMEQYLSENNLNVYYYDDGYISNRNTTHIISQTGEIGYLQQDMSFISALAVEDISLRILIADAKFESFDKYNDFGYQTSVEGVAISYKYISSTVGEEICAQFEIDNTTYYLSIIQSTRDNPIEYYVNLLLN